MIVRQKNHQEKDPSGLLEPLQKEKTKNHTSKTSFVKIVLPKPLFYRSVTYMMVKIDTPITDTYYFRSSPNKRDELNDWSIKRDLLMDERMRMNSFS